VEVFRGEQIVASLEGIIGEGDVAFEINHPGGYCWGDGTGLKVTPDIRPGDRVALRFGDEKAGDRIVQDTAVDTETILNGNTVIVKGKIAAGRRPQSPRAAHRQPRPHRPRRPS